MSSCVVWQAGASDKQMLIMWERENFGGRQPSPNCKNVVVTQHVRHHSQTSTGEFSQAKEKY
ncbi:hypothetical protein MUK42_35868 [Musa troglodytarum]|uniref:Uncharacterized protein n=1 Tax=Musa troglodytarum TaxID=320322 RepID=A0A9E7EBL0_9LILI|nr:hypothetical protein MUK42_35868 [Musa troglodytarum]